MAPVYVFLFALIAQAGQMPADQALKLLRSDQWEAAKFVLVSNPSRTEGAVLSALDSTESLVKRRAAIVLGEMGEPDAFPALAKAAKVSDADMRDECVRAMIAIGSHRGYFRTPELRSLVKLGSQATPALVGILDTDEDLTPKHLAASVLAHTLDRKALPSLLRTLNTARGDDAWPFLTALGKYDDPRAIQALIDHADIIVSDTPRSASVEILAHIGKRAVPALVRALRSQAKATIRGYCACSLARIGDLSSLQALQRATRDPDATVRYYAYQGLAAIPNPSSTQTIFRGLRDFDDVVQIKAVEAAGANKLRAAYDVVFQMTRSQSKPLREAAVACLLNLDEERAIPDLLRFLSIDNLRETTIDAFGDHHIERVWRALLPFLSSPDMSLADSAALALGDLQCRDAVPGLIDLVKRGSYLASGALKEIGRPAVPALIEALKNEDIRDEAIRTLAEIGDQRAANPILDLIVKGQAVFEASDALATFGETRAIDPLIRMLREDKRDRWRIIDALGQLRAKAATPALIALLDDSDCGVNAAQALGEIGDPAALEPMLKVFATRTISSGDGRWMFLEGLGPFKDERVFGILTKALDDGWPDSAAAARGLGMQGNSRAIPALRELLDSDDTQAFDDAREAIRKLGGGSTKSRDAGSSS